MKQFYEDFGVIISFLIMTLIIGMIGGEKLTKYFLGLTIAGMCIFNSEKVVTLLKSSFTVKEDE